MLRRALPLFALTLLVACQPATTGGPSVSTPAARKTYAAAPAMTIDINKSYTATLETTKGTIVIDLKPKDAPASVNNFVFLAREGIYDGLTFHRVENWVIQGGDPTGTGGPGYRWNDEPVKGEYVPGVLAMANAGPNTNGSQFFILKAATPLPKAYNLFGQVTTGQDVVTNIAIGDKMNKVTITEK